MKITLKDGSVKEYESAMSIIEIAKDISEGLARVACAGEINGEVADLRTVVDKDCELSILTFDDEAGKAAYRHTCSHVLAEAVKRLYPEAKLAIGPSIDTGFYYDFDHESFSREDLDKIEAEMKKIIKEGAEIKRFELPREEAIKFMEEREEPYKAELIRDLPEEAVISFYSQGDFTDLCAGPHLMSTKTIKAFKLISSSGAYWRGSEKNKMLSRIYGTAYTKKADLDAYLEHLEDIKKRDHNKLGREMEIFTTVDVIGQGLPLIMPNGVIIMNELKRWIEDEETKRGYMRTQTPLMAKSDLYKISGHWDHYKDGMFVLGDVRWDEEGIIHTDGWDGIERDEDKYYAVMMRNLHEVLDEKGVNLVITILNPSGENGNQRVMKSITENRDTLITNMIAFANKYEFDGIDLDWEFPLSQDEFDAYNSFLQELKARMKTEMWNKEDATLSLALATWALKYTPETIECIDYVNVMGYDILDQDGQHSSFFSSCVQAADYIEIQGFSKEQINIGFPFYGTWEGGRMEQYAYNAISEEISPFNNFYTMKKSDTKEDRYTYFNSQAIIRDKTAYAYLKGYGGVMIFSQYCDLPSDDERSLTKAISDYLQEVTK